MIQDSVGNTIEPDVGRFEHKVNINDLPGEVLLNIFCYLSPMDLRDIRLVCTHWNNVVLDKAAWTRAFDSRFRTGSVFASVTGSSLWILEYFGRVALLRSWAKAKSVAKLYTLVNSEYGLVDRVAADFVHDRLLTFSKTLGTVTSCTLTLGKNQVFIPETQLFAMTLAFDVNWNYLCVGTFNGDVYLKNLITATSSASNRRSISTLASCDEPIVDVKLNPELDKHRERADVLFVTKSGLVSFVNLNGVCLHKLTLTEPVVHMDTDFKTNMVVITATNIIVADFLSKSVKYSIPHNWHFEAKPVVCDVDLHDLNVVLGHENTFRVFHLSDENQSMAEGTVGQNSIIINGTLLENDRIRDSSVAGGDGRLYALTLSDGCVAVFELREAVSPIAFKTVILPFDDDRTPQNIHMYTKVALNSSVIAIGALADWLHFYDAHSGHYLREGPKVPRKLTRDGVVPILYIKFAPKGSIGVVVSGDVVQYFRYGDLPPESKNPNAPQACDLGNKRAIQQSIKAQLNEYDELEHNKQQAADLADKFNGTAFDNELEELRVAMALSASTVNEEDSELERALELLREDGLSSEPKPFEDEWEVYPLNMEPQVGTSGVLESKSNGYNSEDEMLQKVLQLSLLEN